MPNRKPTTVRTSKVCIYQLRHLYASFGALLKTDIKSLQTLLGHSKFSTTMDIYANSQTEKLRETSETIDDFITSLASENSSESMEELLQKIRDINLYSLEQGKVKYYKQELIRLTNIQRLEDQVKDLILKLSNTEDTTEDKQERLNLIYSLLNNMEEFKNQTRAIKRDINKCNDDYNYIFHYLQTIQNLIKTMNSAKKYKKVKQTGIVKPFAINY